MNCKEVEEILNPEKKRDREICPIETRTNPVADMINEVAKALGINTALIKEEFNPAKPFFFQKYDIQLLDHFMKSSKSKEWKRLRCRDFKGAGVECINEATDIILTLAEHAGAPIEWVELEKIRSEEFTGQFVLQECIKKSTPEYTTDLSEHFFAPVGNCQDDDKMNEADRQVFLTFLYTHPYISPADMRGIYWFFVMEKEKQEQISFIEGAKEIQNFSPDQLSEFKDHLTRRINLEKSLSNDSEYITLHEENDAILSGKGKLQDKKKLRENEKKLEKILTSHIKIAFAIDDIDSNKCKSPPVPLKQIYDEMEEKYKSSRESLIKATQEYSEWKYYRSLNPVTDEDERLFEISFRERFGFPVFGNKERDK